MKYGSKKEAKQWAMQKLRGGLVATIPTMRAWYPNCVRNHADVGHVVLRGSLDSLLLMWTVSLSSRAAEY
jgi:hypothetical protein